MSGTCGSILPCLVYLLAYRRVSQERLHAQLPHKRNIPNITWRAFSVEAVGTSHDTSMRVVCKRAAFVWSSPRALSFLFTNNGWKWSSSAQDAFCRRVAGSIAGDHAGQRPAAHYFRQRPRCFGAALSTFIWNSGTEERRHRSVTRFLQQLPREGLEQHRFANMGQTRVHTGSARRTCNEHALNIHLTHI